MSYKSIYEYKDKSTNKGGNYNIILQDIFEKGKIFEKMK